MPARGTVMLGCSVLLLAVLAGLATRCDPAGDKPAAAAGEADPPPRPNAGARKTTRPRSGPDEKARDHESEARSLSTTELIARLRGMDHLDPLGEAGRIRCALFAEWGERDREAAFEFLTKELQLEDIRVLQQIRYAIFVGWARHDPQAALASQNAGTGQTRLLTERSPSGFRGTWSEPILHKRLRQTAMSEWAARDAAAALEFLSGCSGQRSDLLCGYLHATWNDAPGQALAYIERRIDEEADSLQQRRAATSAARDGSGSALVKRPPVVDEIATVAAAMAGDDFASAVAWLQDLGIGSRTMILQRWQSQAPDQAAAWFIEQVDQGATFSELELAAMVSTVARESPAMLASRMDAMPREAHECLITNRNSLLLQWPDVFPGGIGYHEPAIQQRHQEDLRLLLGDSEQPGR